MITTRCMMHDRLDDRGLALVPSALVASSSAGSAAELYVQIPASRYANDVLLQFAGPRQIYIRTTWIIWESKCIPVITGVVVVCAPGA